MCLLQCSGHATLPQVHYWISLVSLKHVCATIDNIRHYGYETNKRHLNQASFAPPTKFVNIFVLERKYVLCALNCLAITKAVAIRVVRIHTIANKEWILKVPQLWKVRASSICVYKIHCMEKRYGTKKQHIRPETYTSTHSTARKLKVHREKCTYKSDYSLANN